MSGKIYKNRYYASYHKEKGHVTGWYDIKSLTHTDNVPDEKDLIPLTEEDWNKRKTNGHGVKDGKLIEMIQVINIPMIEQAKDALSIARRYVQNHFILLGEVPTQEWITYQKDLMAYIEKHGPESAEVEATEALPVSPVVSRHKLTISIESCSLNIKC